MLKACMGLNCSRQIDYVDRRSCQLTEIPDEIYRYEDTLEDLMLDSNMIQELPPKFFRLTNLRKLTLCENEIMRLSPMIANFTKLIELDISKNCLEEVPSNIQFCRSLGILDISCNPLLRIPDCVANIGSLTHLFINDVALPALPREIGNLQNLVVLEARENVLRRVPPSLGDLSKLERLDLGNNEIEELPPTFGYLEELTELWLDSNCLSLLPESLSRLHKLYVLDVTKNKLERFPNHFANLVNLVDLHASENCIECLPDNFGLMKSLVQIKLDLNHLVYLPDSIGNLQRTTEIFLFENMLETIPPSIFNIPTLQMLNIDRNHIMQIPPTIGRCKSLHVFSARENDLRSLPEEMGQLSSLRVLDVCGNRLHCLPLSISNLDLDAFWISGNQPLPLISLHQEPDPDNPDKKILTCQFFPQMGPETSEFDYVDNSDPESEESGFSQRRRNSAARKSTRLAVAFDPGTSGLPSGEEGGGKFVRFPTPFRKDLKNKHKRPKLDARPRTTVFRKGSMDDLTLHSVEPSSTTPPELQVADSNRSTEEREVPATQKVELPPSGPLLRSYDGIHNLSEGYIPGAVEEEELTRETESEISNADHSQLPPRSRLQTLEVMVELNKDNARFGLGFSIAGGKGSTPAYEDVDESIFITRIIRGGPAEKDGRLRLGDKLLSVNGVDMTDATHMFAVSTLRNSQRRCVLRVSREVLVVLPDDAPLDEDEYLPTLANGDLSHVHPQDETTPTPDNEEGSAVERVMVSAEVSDREGEALILDEEEGEKREEEDGEEEREIAELAEEMFGDDEEVKKEEEEAEEEGKRNRGDPYVNIHVAQTLRDEAIEIEKAKKEEEEERARREKEEEEERLVPVAVSTDSGLDSPALTTTTPNTNASINEEVITLDRSYSNLGMHIIGGCDYVNRIFGCGQSGIYISKVSAGGSAAATGKLRFGDRILSVNGVSMEGLTHDQAVECLISQEGPIELSVRHETQPKGMMEVRVDKGKHRKLGISIKGGAPTSHGNPLDHEDEGIFISKITRGEAAERDGRLSVGQRILEVNGFSLLGASHVEAVRALRSAEEVMTLLVCDGYSFDDFIKNMPIGRSGKLTGSVDVLNEGREIKTHKRIHSSNSATALENEAERMEDLNAILQQLVQFKSSTPTAGRGGEEEGREEQGEKEEMVDDSASIAELEQSVVDMEKEAEKLLKETVRRGSSSSFASRRESVEQARIRQEEKQEELQSFINEVFLEEINENEVAVNKNMESEENEKNKEVNNKEEEEEEEEWVVIDSDVVRNEIERQRSLSASTPPPSMTITTPLLRPQSAQDVHSRQGKKEAPPPVSPKPIALISPEKLPFRERIAIYQAKVTREEEKASYRRSWAPGISSPRSRSLSPVYNKWPSASYIGRASPMDSNSVSATDKENQLILPNPVTSRVVEVKDEAPEQDKEIGEGRVEEMKALSVASITSDPPLTSSPLSPPIGEETEEDKVTGEGEDPGFSPVPDENQDKQEPLEKPFSIDEELAKNPYVLQALDSLPNGPSIDESELPPPTTEEQKRRREWRERKRREMDAEIERVLGPSSPS